MTEDRHILVVEDITLNREHITSMLGKLGYACDTVANGLEALEKLKQRKFDLVFLDMQIPALNGYDTAFKIRNELNLASETLPVIALTTYGQPEETARCFEAGINDCLTKPVEFIELAAKIDEWLCDDGDTWDIEPHESTSYENVPLITERELKEFIGFLGIEKLQGVYTNFADDNKVSLEILRSVPGDKNGTRSTLHNLTSVSGSLGMKKLSLYAQYLLNQGVARDRPAEQGELDLLDNIFQESCRAFERFLST